MKIAIVIGNRPHFIKCAPFLRELRHHTDIHPVLIHSGQHYDMNLSGVFIKDFNFPPVDYNLSVGSSAIGVQTGTILARLDPVFREIGPDCVVSMGDTNTTLAAALAAYQQHIPNAHIEAGMREHAWRPEEINKKMADHCADYLFAPIPRARDNLLAEGIEPERIFVTGDITYDTFCLNRQAASYHFETFRDSMPGLRKPFHLVTLHRAETVDDPDLLAGILTCFARWPRAMLFPLHPRTARRIREFGLEDLLAVDHIRVVDPLSYMDFIAALIHCELVATDSSGVLKESFYARKPCVLMDDSTEYGEIFELGGAVMAGRKGDVILDMVKTMMTREPPAVADSPFGDGRAAARMVDAIRTVPPFFR